MTNVIKLYIKGMVCERCIAVIKAELRSIGLVPEKIELGEITLISAAARVDMQLIDSKLRSLGFGMLQDRKQAVVNEVRALVEEVYSGDYDFPSHFRREPRPAMGSAHAAFPSR
ncbi:MAG: hypothetical protein JST42_25700 [Bacteroidetes bacterium]|nr:hypothetical protein [Bacteroidota bacterium]